MLIMKLLNAIVYNQPNFPLVDISDIDAKALQDALSDPAALTAMHHAAEEVHPQYRDTHAMVTAAVEAEFGEDRARAASVGLAAYEATSCLVQLTAPAIDREARPVICGEPYIQIVVSSLQKYLDAFCSQMPNTATVVRYVATQYIDGDGEQALLGAATSRALDLELRKLR